MHPSQSCMPRTEFGTSSVDLPTIALHTLDLRMAGHQRHTHLPMADDKANPQTLLQRMMALEDRVSMNANLVIPPNSSRFVVVAASKADARCLPAGSRISASSRANGTHKLGSTAGS